MARLATEGFEGMGRASPAGAATGTTNVRSGSRSLQPGFLWDFMSFNGAPNVVLGTTYYIRGHVYFTALPSVVETSSPIMTVAGYFGRVTSDGRWRLYSAGTQTLVGESAAGAVQLNTWHRVELGAKLATGALDYGELRVDGVTIASETNVSRSDAIPSAASVRTFTGTDGTSYADDCALNDSTGATQNSWPGEGRIINLQAVADSARGANWTAGAGGTTSLFLAVDNVPPAGVVLASATNTSQIKNAAKDIVGTYDATLQSYDAAGLAAGDTITLVQPQSGIGNSTATARSMALAGASNPVITENTGFTTSPGSTAAAWPGGWVGLYGNAAVSPAVARGTGPVIRVRKNASVTDTAMVCHMSMAVEYVPGAPKSLVVAHRTSRNALLRR